MDKDVQTTTDDEVAQAVADVETRDTAPSSRHAWFTAGRHRLGMGQSYTRFVDVMKLLLPAFAVVLVAALVGYSALYQTPADIAKTFGDIRKMGEHLEMTKPVLTFTDKQSRNFVVQATTATQIQGSNNRWQLSSIQAKMQPREGALVHLTSQSGVLDTEQQQMDLAGDVLVTTEDGRRFEARTAHVDFGKGDVTSEEPVRAATPGGTVESDRFRLTESGKRIFFDGRVRFKTTPKHASDAPGEASETGPGAKVGG